MASFGDTLNLAALKAHGRYHPLLPQIVKTIRDRAAEGDEEIEQQHNRGQDVSIGPFGSDGIPPISVGDYLHRFCANCLTEPQALIAAFVLLERLLARTPWRLSSWNVHRLLAAVIVVALKTVSDCPSPNKHYAMVAGLPNSELNLLERTLLTLLDCNLVVSREEIEAIAVRFS
eukprot:Hpha_TRINITY_DN14701_c0_g3::TRINITY_DN14701_c0_g3_i1::g.102402::m.102402